jgi:uncharacterized membrane protein
MKGSKDILNLILAIALVIGFIFFVLIMTYGIKEHYNLTCSCTNSLPIVVSILASLGIFVGLLTYYFLSKSFFKQKEKLYGDVEKTLNFLDSEEKKIVLALISKKGECAQSSLSKLTGIDAVKLHRRLLNLELKKVIHKEKMGMTNKIVIENEFKEIFIK